MNDDSGAGIGNLNPFRYRGYFYDDETGWYYLKSRYYDPEVGRFINSDSVLPGVKGSVQGYNLYGYCRNAPINLEDSMGTAPKSCGRMKSASAYGNPIIKPKKIEVAIKKLIADLKKFDKTNEDIEKVYQAYFISSYKGKLVIRHSDEFLTSWAIGGVIYLTYNDDYNYHYKLNTLNHEYGHLLQEEAYGMIRYVGFVALPSVVYNLVSRESDLLQDHYYNMPWEYDADKRAGVNRGYSYWAESITDIYFDKLIGD